MRARLLAPFAAALVITLAVGCSPKTGRFQYPDTHRSDQVDVLHGVKVADPYRWLEDLNAPETAAWVAAQNEVTFGYLQQIPARDAIRERMTALWDYERYGIPRQEGGRYFYSKNDGLQPQPVLYVADSLDAEPRVLINPNTLSEDGTVALAGTYASDGGGLMAYAISSAGSDWKEFRVRDVDTGEDLPDVIKWVKFSGASWTKDGTGFYYSRYDEPEGDELAAINRFPKVYYHKLGTPQADDELIYHRPDQPDWGFNAFVTDDGDYLIISISKGTERRNRVAYQNLAQGGGRTVDLLTDFDAQYAFIGNDGERFWFFTDKDAPRGRVIEVNIRTPQPQHWQEIIPQADETLRDVNLVNNMFVASYLKDAHSVVRIYDTDGQHVRNVELPGLGTVGGFGGDPDDRETFYAYTSFTSPTTIYRYDMQTGGSTVFRRPAVDFDPDDYVTRQVFYRSKDGTRVPMFINHKKGIKLDGQNPTLLYGYGGFNAALTPSFRVHRLVWLELGGIYAIANIRGGGEYGKAWHDAGRLDNKQNCFDDFIAAGEWLIHHRYTSSGKLAIAGGSNGGLLVGACITQRPDLFGAALPAVGVMDMLRFHKFTIGWAWKSDYGDPDDPEDFKVLLSYSPLHNIVPGTCYPAVMATTADHDDRVVPSHSFKFISEMQHAQGCDNPVLIRIETKAGHGGGKPTQKIIEEISDEYAFLVHELAAGPVELKE